MPPSGLRHLRETGLVINRSPPRFRHLKDGSEPPSTPRAYRVARRAPRRLQGLTSPLPIGPVIQFGLGDAEDLILIAQLALAGQPVEREQQFAVHQVARGPENKEQTRLDLVIGHR